MQPRWLWRWLPHRLITVNNTPIQDYIHPDDHPQPTYKTTPGFKPFTVLDVELSSFI